MGTCHGKLSRYGKKKNDRKRVWYKTAKYTVYPSEKDFPGSTFVPVQEYHETISPGLVQKAHDGELDSDAQSCFSDESVVSHRLARFDTDAGSAFSSEVSPVGIVHGGCPRGGRVWGEFIDFEENLRLTLAVSPDT